MDKAGMTSTEIQSSHVHIYTWIDIEPSYDGPWMAGCLTNSVIFFAKFFTDDPPDMVLVLGDRFEIFGVAAAAVTCGIPVAHIAGGETTQGAVDEYYRHCITKMASLHFTEAEVYRKRVIQLGEDPGSVFNVGALGVENALSIEPLNRDDFVRQVGSVAKKPFLLCTVHPETLDCTDILSVTNALCSAIEQLQLPCLFTGANIDEGGDVINKAVQDFCRRYKKGKFVMSLGSTGYLSALRLCSAVCGNSSSGIMETAALGVPTVNIGDRQRGRLMADNVICCPAHTDDVVNAIQKATSPDFMAKIKDCANPFGNGDTSSQICSILLNRLRSPISRRKIFYDVNFEVTQ